MSLQVWLPLNGDLTQQGASGVIATGNNITVNTGGKIGSCYSFNGSSSSIKLNESLFTNAVEEFSFTCWVKPNSTASGCLYSARTETNFYGITIFINNSGSILYDIGNERRTKGQTLSTGVWHHLAFTYKKGKYKKIYLNGTEIDSVTSTGTSTYVGPVAFIGASQNTSTSVNANYLNGYLNDVRIYDHCLSVAEVKEISQGLLVHYKLDDIPQNFSKNTNTNWTNVTLGQYYVTIFSYTMADFQALTGAKNGDKFTWSLDLNSTGGTKHITAHVQHYNTDSDRVSAIGNPIAPNTSGRSSITFTINTAYKQLDFMITNSDSGSITANSTEQYKNTKIQAGDVSTAWVPTGLEEIIEDSSGYGHNGTVTGTLTLSSNTSRYSASSQFVAGTKIAGSGFVTSQSPTFTLSYWIHMDGGTYTTWADTVSFTGNKTFRQETRNTAGTSLGWYNYPLGTSSGTGGTTIALNTWTHLALASDGTNFYFYKNGALYSTVALTGTAWTPNGNFTLGDASNMFMRMSDFRLYCTALSADDILQLYHTSAKVDNLGGTHAFEINENKVNKLTKTGILYDNLAESIMTLPDGSHWQLLMFHYVDDGKNLFTSSNANNCNDFGLFSRLKDIDGFKLNNKYEFYAIQDDTAYRWIQTNAPLTTTEVAGFSAVNGYNSPGAGICKCSGNTLLARTNSTGNWWNAVGCYTIYHNGIPGFNSITCKRYMALYARIEKADVKLSNQTANASNFIEL